MNNGGKSLSQEDIARAQALFSEALKGPHKKQYDTGYPDLVWILKDIGVDWDGGQGYEILGVRKEVFDGLCLAKAAYLWDKAQRKKETTFPGMDSGPREGFALSACLENLRVTGVDLTLPESWVPLNITPEDFRKECSAAASRIGNHFSSKMALSLSSLNIDSARDCMIWMDLYEKMIAMAGEDIESNTVNQSHGLESVANYRRMRQEVYMVFVPLPFDAPAPNMS